MEYDFSDIIVEQVRQAQPDLDARLEAQAEALNELECTNRVIGRWIDEYGLEYLQAAFDLDDKEFAENFPDLAHIKEEDRQKIIRTFTDHVRTCLRCSRATAYHAEMDGRINRAIHAGQDVDNCSKATCYHAEMDDRMDRATHSGQDVNDKVLDTPNEPHHFCASPVVN